MKIITTKNNKLQVYGERVEFFIKFIYFFNNLYYVLTNFHHLFTGFFWAESEIIAWDHSFGFRATDTVKIVFAITFTGV